MTSETTGASAELSPEERELQALAIQERFAAEYRAGRNPRLADYLRAYPEYAGSLADFVARLLDEGEADESDTAPAPLSSGSRRALEAIFGEALNWQAGQAVAETRARYTLSASSQASDDQASDTPEDAPRDG